MEKKMDGKKTHGFDVIIRREGALHSWGASWKLCTAYPWAEIVKLEKGLEGVQPFALEWFLLGNGNIIIPHIGRGNQPYL